MKNWNIVLSFLAIGFFVASFSYGEEAKVSKPTPSPTATESVTITATETPTPAPRYIPAPPISEENRFLKYQVDTYLLSNNNGTNLNTYGDILFRKRLDQYNTSAEGDVRIGKSFSSNDTADTIDLLTAKVSYSALFLTFSAGRFDIGSSLSPMRFFGNYATMGIVRADGIEMTLPLTFSLGVQDLTKVESSSSALSFFYFPSLLSAEYASYDTSQAFFLSQLRIGTEISGIPLVFRVNAGADSTQYFSMSSLNGNLTLSGAVEATIEKDFMLYGEYGVQNPNYWNDTSALSVGIRDKSIYTFGPLSFDLAAIEVQFPFTSTEENIFAGGNNFDQSLATQAQKTIFAQVQARLEELKINFSITDTPGDFTFARVNSANSSFPLTSPIGLANQIPGLDVPLYSSGYGSWVWALSFGVDF